MIYVQIFFGIIFLGFILFLARRYWPSNTGSFNFDQLNTYWDKKWFRVTVGVILINLSFIIFPLTRGWWYTQWSTYWYLLLPIHLIIGIGASMIPDNPRNPADQKIGRWVFRLGIVCLLFYLGGDRLFEKKTEVARVPKINAGEVVETGWGFRSDLLNILKSWFPEKNTVYLHQLTPYSREVAEKSMAFWRSQKDIPKDQQELMIAIEWHESKFRQVGDDGNAFRGVNPKDVCSMMINETAWLKKSLTLGSEYSLETLEGCLNMSLLIYRERGASEWTSYDKAVAMLASKPEGFDVIQIALTPEMRREQPVTERPELAEAPEAKPEIPAPTPPTPEVLEVSNTDSKEACEQYPFDAPVGDVWKHFNVGDKKVHLKIGGPIYLNNGVGETLTLDVHERFDVNWKTDYVRISARSERYDGAPNPIRSKVIVYICPA